MAEDTSVEYQRILRERTRPTFERLSITETTETRPNPFVLCIPPTHKRNKRKHPLQFLCQTRERKLTPSDRQVCIHKDWWTEIIWNKDEECYYTNGILKRLHDYDETDSEEESQDSNTEEPTIDQQIRQAPIDPTLKTSLLTTTTKLPESTMTTTTEQTTATTTIYEARGRIRTAWWRRVRTTWRRRIQTTQWRTSGRRTTPGSSTTSTPSSRC